ncbi:MAG: ABC transporter ATP-binding protein [Acidimicrobiia bacterium]|nr:ABC transporter ATP-binding protein [Acidimicrobiia bacterium]
MLQCLRLSVQFAETLALDTVNLTVHDGEVVAVMGPSGCGKTTLLRAVAGLQRLDEGTIAWDGRNLRGTPPHARGFGLMFQDYALFPHLDVSGNVEFGLRMQGLPDGERSTRVDRMLRLVGLDGYADRAIHELSGGEQQRVALARTLAPAPRLVLLDEPIGALDRTLREHLIDEMRAIFTRLGVTALYVTHDRDEAFAVADTVAVMDRGRIIRRGTPQEIWNDPQSGFVARLLGFDAHVDAKAHDSWVDLGWGRAACRLSPGRHRIAVPPHAVEIADDGAIEGTVRSVTYRAGMYDVEIQVADTLLQASSRERCAPGSQIRFDIIGSALLVIDAD